MRQLKYIKPKIELILVPVETGIAASSIQTGGTQSTPIVEDWIDEERTNSYFFDN